ncbi:MAG: hypothetical protein M3044_21040 [Thermoproteota archaeon]|nr:hypothetical protein [Thermoproteota archaeon]
MINGDIDPLNTEEIEPLTTALGIKCNEAIVLASDSQSTAKTGNSKNLDATKIIQINKFIGMTGSGDSYHLKLIADEAKERFGEKKFSQTELEKSLNTMMKDLHKDITHYSPKNWAIKR